MVGMERNGVRVGQRVRDLDGNDVGRVTRLYQDGFDVSKGFPILFRKDVVARYDEVRGIQGGVVVLARSRGDLQDLAAGHVPRAWRIPGPPEYPTTATPAEAGPVLQDLAAGAIVARDAEAGGPVAPRAPEDPGEARERPRGDATSAPRPHAG